MGAKVRNSLKKITGQTLQDLLQNEIILPSSYFKYFDQNAKKLSINISDHHFEHEVNNVIAEELQSINDYMNLAVTNIDVLSEQAENAQIAIAEKDSELVFIPVEKLEEWMIKYSSWRSFVIDSYDIRLNEMLEAIDTLAFLKMDERLFKYLIDKVQIMRSTELHTTHQEIAVDLNTSRVVVSRLLKQLENEGRIKLFRNKIEVLDF